MQKVVVIGCNSFSGGYVVDELLASGQYQVLGVDRVEKTAAFLPYVKRDMSHFRFAKIDLNKDMAELQTILTSEQPDYVMNLAAQSEVAQSWEHPEHWMQTNVVALTELVNFLRTLPNLKKYTHISTPEVYGSVTGGVKEDTVINPSTPYAVSKAGADLLLLAFFKNYDFPIVLMRASNVYGAHQQLFKIIPRTVIYAKLGKTLRLDGGGTAVRLFIHVRDVARGYIGGMFSGRPGEIYHVGPSESVTIRGLVEKIYELTGDSFAAGVEVGPERPGHDAAYELDASKIRGELGWTTRVTLTEGLQEVIDWVERDWETIKDKELEYVHQA